MTGSTHTTSLEWLFGLEQFGVKFGLDNITVLLDALGRPERHFKTVHVGGTNGKGSVTAMVDTALRAAGHRSARYTSPHLVDVTERFVIDGHPIHRDVLAATVDDVRATVDHLRRAGPLRALPTFFEVTTAAAFELFRQAAVNVAVCEVGLGGRLDATNVLEPAVSAITSLGLDHQQHLGTTLRAIAIEKAGIIKPGVPVVVGRMPAEALDQIEAIARDRGAECIQAWQDTTVEEAPARPGDRGPTAAGRQRTRVTLRTPSCDYGELEIALPGAHQIGNAVVAVRLLETLDRIGLPVPNAAIATGLAHVRWPGRLEFVSLPDGREVLLDAAHNPDGAAALAQFLAAAPGPFRPLVFGAMEDKDVAGMLRRLIPVVSALVLTRASTARAADPLELASAARSVAPELRLAVHASPRDALGAAWQIAPRILVAGSIALLGDVMKAIARP